MGDGPLRGKLELLAHNLGVANEVRFLGSLPSAAVDEQLAAARVFCAPSRTAPNGDCEGFGQVFLEAALAGTPAVARWHGGVPEAVAHEETGLLSQPGNIEALATDLLRLLTDEQLCTRMGTAARQRARHHFDIEVRVRDLERIYNQASG